MIFFQEKVIVNKSFFFHGLTFDLFSSLIQIHFLKGRQISLVNNESANGAKVFLTFSFKNGF